MHCYVSACLRCLCTRASERACVMFSMEGIKIYYSLATPNQQTHTHTQKRRTSTEEGFIYQPTTIIQHHRHTRRRWRPPRWPYFIYYQNHVQKPPPPSPSLYVRSSSSSSGSSNIPRRSKVPLPASSKNCTRTDSGFGCVELSVCAEAGKG